MNTRIAAVVTVGIAGLVLSGCGSSGSEAEATEAVASAATSAVGEALESAMPQVTELPSMSIPPDQPNPQAELELVPGASVVLPAITDDGLFSLSTPVTAAFDRMECGTTLPGMEHDTETYETKDWVAEPGKQACMIILAITNNGDSPVRFDSEYDVMLLAANGKTYATPANRMYEVEDYAAANNMKSASDVDLMNPGDTQYDFTMWEIPLDTTPQAYQYDIYVSSTSGMD